MSSERRELAGHPIYKMERPPPPHQSTYGAKLVLKREELYRAIWEQSATKVANRFGISGSMLGRICTALQVPKPGRGYWAKPPGSRQYLRKRLLKFKGIAPQHWAVKAINVESQKQRPPRAGREATH